MKKQNKITIVNKIEKFLDEKNIEKFEDVALLNPILNKYKIHITSDINEFDVKNGKEIYRTSPLLSKGGTISTPCIHIYVLKMDKNKILLYGKIKNIYLVFEREFDAKKYDEANKSDFVKKIHDEFETEYINIASTIFTNIQLKIENKIADKLLNILEKWKQKKN